MKAWRWLTLILTVSSGADATATGGGVATDRVVQSGVAVQYERAAHGAYLLGFSVWSGPHRRFSASMPWCRFGDPAKPFDPPSRSTGRVSRSAEAGVRRAGTLCMEIVIRRSQFRSCDVNRRTV